MKIIDSTGEHEILKSEDCIYRGDYKQATIEALKESGVFKRNDITLYIDDFAKNMGITNELINKYRNF